MKTTALLSSVAALVFALAAAPHGAAAAGTADAPAPAATDAAVPAAVTAAPDAVPAGDVAAMAPAKPPATACLKDLSVFNAKMEKDGYWYGGAGYNAGYPVAGYGYGDIPGNGTTIPSQTYESGRPGYELRNLMSTAAILGRRGEQQPCENVLASARDIYTGYMAELRSGKAPQAYGSNWQQVQIAAAVAVAGDHTAFRSDQLVGADVRNAGNDALGTVSDIVISPSSGKIAYLVIGRGGFFGIDEKYVPVPWANFKITPTGHTLVLNVTKEVLDQAPQVKRDEQTSAEALKPVDAWWLTHGQIASVN